MDNDCDGIIDEDCGTDNDSDGYYSDADCNDDDAEIYPGATEIPEDGTDQDCNGFDAIFCYRDIDQDGYGDYNEIPIIASDGTCDSSQSESDNTLDCNDLNAEIHPGELEIPDNGVDEDCDGWDGLHS